MLDFPLFNAVVSGPRPTLVQTHGQAVLVLGPEAHRSHAERNMSFPLPGVNLYVMPASV